MELVRGELKRNRRRGGGNLGKVKKNLENSSES
jgi:hypothetical protein